MRYPDGFAAYVVGAACTTDDVSGAERLDEVETAELGWFPPGALPETINAYNTQLLRRAGIGRSTTPHRPQTSGV